MREEAVFGGVADGEDERGWTGVAGGINAVVDEAPAAVVVYEGFVWGFRSARGWG